MNKYSNNRLRRSFSKEVEAAWYVLKPFFHPLDCAEKRTYSIQDPNGDGTITKSGVYPLNVNYVLAYVLSGDTRYRPRYMTKARLEQHLSQLTTYYYRSSYQAIHSKGYGSSLTQALNLPFAQDLGISSIRIYYEGSYYILLLGIDIDAHHGQTDSLAVEQWLKTIFPESYWEPSSSFTGRHGYVKLAYPCNLKLSTVLHSLKFLFSVLDQKRQLLGYQSTIDVPCGLPSTLSLVPEYPYLRDEIEDLTSASCSDYSMSVLTQLTGKDYSQGLYQGQFIKLNRSQAFKFPRFNATDPSKCSMVDIVSFYEVKFYSFSFMTDLIHSLQKDLSIPLFSEGENNKREEGILLSTVCSPLGTRSPRFLDWTEIVEQEITLEDYWIHKKKRQSVSYQKRIDEIKSIQDTKRKTGLFYWYYAVYLHRVPSVDEAIQEYIHQGLNTSEDLDSKRRRNRFEYCYKYILKRFDAARCGFHIGDWCLHQISCMDLIQTHLSDPKQLTWKKDNQKRYSLKIEELALVYFSIQRSNECDRRKSDTLIQNSFSYKRIQSIFKMVLGKGCHRAKCSRIMQVLLEIGLIEKTGNYICSVRGNCYKVKPA